MRTERHFQVFLASLVLLPLLLGGLGLLLLRARGAQMPPLTQVALLLALVALGSYLPVLWLRRKIRARQKAMFRALPDALDLMTIGVTAGLSLDGAMLEIVEKWETELSNELALVLHELRMGVGRREAL
jgi:tight adherence protein C